MSLTTTERQSDAAPVDHVRAFVEFELAQAGGKPIKREFSEWVAAYMRWASSLAIEPLPSSIFLNSFAKTPGVKKKIARQKDPKTGRVMKLPSGSPVRGYFYILRRELSQQPLVVMSTPRPTSQRIEPIETEDPLNSVLDAIEQLIRSVVANGGEAPLRYRLRRLLTDGSHGSL